MQQSVSHNLINNTLRRWRLRLSSHHLSSDKSDNCFAYGDESGNHESSHWWKVQKSEILENQESMLICYSIRSNAMDPVFDFENSDMINGGRFESTDRRENVWLRKTQELDVDSTNDVTIQLRNHNWWFERITSNLSFLYGWWETDMQDYHSNIQLSKWKRRVKEI